MKTVEIYVEGLTEPFLAHHECPGCGLPNLYIDSYFHPEQPRFTVNCDDCGHTGPFGFDEDEAVMYWNRGE
jgi:hypothetical protein